MGNVPHHVEHIRAMRSFYKPVIVVFDEFFLTDLSFFVFICFSPYTQLTQNNSVNSVNVSLYQFTLTPLLLFASQTQE